MEKMYLPDDSYGWTEWSRNKLLLIFMISKNHESTKQKNITYEAKLKKPMEFHLL